jgi:hypothetical protein
MKELVNRYGKTHCRKGHDYALYGKVQPHRENRIMCTACTKEAISKKHDPEHILMLLEKHDVSLTSLAPIIGVSVGSIQNWACCQPDDIKLRLAAYKYRNIKKFDHNGWDVDVEVKRKTYTDYENKGIPKLAMGKANVKLQGAIK